MFTIWEPVGRRHPSATDRRRRGLIANNKMIVPFDSAGAPRHLLHHVCVRIDHATARTPRLLADRKPPAAATAGRAAPDPVAADVTRAMGHLAADGADGDHAAAGPADAPRPSELELARIRDAGRLLAIEARVRAAEDDADGDRQRPCLRGLSAGDPGRGRRRLGIERPRLRPDPDAQGRGPTRLNQEGDRHRRQVLGPAAARLVRAGPDADLRHPRFSVAGWHRIYRRLGGSTTSR